MAILLSRCGAAKRGKIVGYATSAWRARRGGTGWSKTEPDWSPGRISGRITLLCAPGKAVRKIESISG